MPHALLLSPDDQAVSAITGVLEEMSVTCERPLDGVSAAQKLNSQNFDLVLVDCENLPAAKLIFDVCRRGKSGNTAVPIAIVDGRAGLPTAFRLGAELILTKPVAKDQARSTIRTAVGRVRKDLPANENASAQAASAPVTPSMTDSATDSVTDSVTEDRTQAQAVSSPSLTYADANPSFARGSVPPSYLTAALSASGLTTRMYSTVDEVADKNERTPETAKLDPQPSSASESSSSESSESPSRGTDSVNAKIARVVNPSDDLVLAELDRVELDRKKEEAESAATKLTPDSAALDKPPAIQDAAKSAKEAAIPYHRGRRRTHAPLVALLMIAIAVGGFYGVWMYQPGFRDVAKPQIDRLLDLAGKGLPPASASNQAKPSPQVAPAQASGSSGPPSVSQDQAPSAVADPATPSSTSSTTAAVAVSPAHPAGEVSAVAAPSSADASSAAPAVVKPVVSKTPVSKTPASTTPASKASATTMDSAASPSAVAPLPGENSAIILSSKGAEKRLAHSVPPKYPVDASPANAQGKATVVLKTVVNANGEVEGVRLVDGNPALASAAMQAVKQWRYRPYVRDGKAQPFQTVVIIAFQRP